jgi:hypothetical protein
MDGPVLSHREASFGIAQQQALGEVLTAVPARLAIFKLLERRIVQSDLDRQRKLAPYRRTPFGKTIMRRPGRTVS